MDSCWFCSDDMSRSLVSIKFEFIDNWLNFCDSPAVFSSAGAAVDRKLLCIRGALASLMVSLKLAVSKNPCDSIKGSVVPLYRPA